MERAYVKMAQPALDEGSSLFRDFQDEPRWLMDRAQRLVAAIQDLHMIEDRPTLANGNDSVAIMVMKSKQPIELLICAWKIMARSLFLNL